LISTSTSSASGSTSTPAALVLQARPHAAARLRPAAALDRHGDVLVAAEVGLVGLDDLGAPTDPLGVAQVHAQQVAGEQRGLLAALARLDLQDDVLVVAGVARDQQQPQPLGELLAPLFERLDLGGEVGVLGAQLTRGGDVVPRPQPLPVRLDDRGELRVPLVEPAGLGLVGVDGWVGQPLLEVGVLADQVLDRLEHGGAPLRGCCWG
jgi:hypothetical protein